MKARLIDFMDPNRPLAKAAMELDWTTVVALFPEAARDGHDAARIWILASILILGEVSGLSESEVLSRWPENPYWQAFSGFAQFQWKTPVTPADCLAFRRYIDAPRAARLSAIAQSILQSKPVEAHSLEAVVPTNATTVDDALALRQVHFLHPQPPQPYKAPARTGFQSGIKQAYARAAAPPSKPAAPSTPEATAPLSPAPPPAPPTPGEAPKPTGVQDAATTTSEAAPLAEPPVPEIPEKPVVPQFAQTYSSLFKKAPLVDKAPPPGTRMPFPMMDGIAFPQPASPEGISAASPTVFPPTVPTFASGSPAPSSPSPAPLPASAFRPVPPAEAAPIAAPRTVPAGTPQFDTTAPFMRRAAPEEPVTMEVVVTGEAPLHYQWETFDDLKGTATPIEGCNEPSLTVALEASDTMLAFQCRVSNGPCPQGTVSRTFFLKKTNTSSSRSSNSFGENLTPGPGKPTAQPQGRR